MQSCKCIPTWCLHVLGRKECGVDVVRLYKLVARKAIILYPEEGEEEAAHSSKILVSILKPVSEPGYFVAS
jgi:hypothetical protein